MKTIKTEELTGPALDWAVATIEGYGGLRRNSNAFDQALIMNRKDGQCVLFSSLKFSTDWAQGGPIIEREKISTAYEPSMIYDDTCRWKAISAISDNEHFYGPTPLIAAMRCYVASKLGNEVEIPGELG